MIQSFPRWPALAFATAALAFTSSGALAQASITLSDPNCIDFTLTGPAGSRTLTCVQSTTPLCTVGGPTTGTLGTPITLIATCVPQAASWSWSGGNCAGVTANNCQDSSNGYTNGQQVTYKVTGTNGQGAGPQSIGQVVTWSTTPVLPPSNCSISGVPSNAQASPYSYALSVNCSGGAATSWQWSSGSTATTQSISGSITATTTFKVIASNSAGSAPQVSGVITIAGGGGGGGGGGPISCSGFAATHVLDVPWATGIIAYTGDAGGFGANDAMVLRFTTPAITSATGKGSIGVATWTGGDVARAGSLSATPCDFAGGIPLNACGGSTTAFNNDIGPVVSISLVARKTCAATLQPSTTYYFNLRNLPGSCTAGVCDMRMVFNKPSGS